MLLGVCYGERQLYSEIMQIPSKKRGQNGKGEEPLNGDDVVRI